MKVVLSAWLALFLWTPLFSQSVKFDRKAAGTGNFGIKMGGGLSSLAGADAATFNTAMNFSLSIYYTLNFAAGKHLEFSQDLGLNKKGAINRVSKEVIELYYFELDNFLKVKFGSKYSTPFVMAGFYLASLINGNALNSSLIKDLVPGSHAPGKTFDYGPFFSIGYDFGSANRGINDREVGIECRYSFGLTGLFENDKPDLRNRVIAGIIRIFLFNI